MCTILAIFGLHPEYPLVIAANRDEFTDRPTQGPTVLTQAPRSVGGVDLREGGSWLGVNEKGVFAALTNQRTYTHPDPGLQSRGQVVRRALGCISPEAIVDQLRGLDATSYNPFNLLFGNADRLYAAYARGSRNAIEIEALAPGIHVLANDRLGSPRFPKAERARRAVYGNHARPWSELSAVLVSMLSDHTLPPWEAIEQPPPGSRLRREQLRALGAICIHTEGYGTRSAALIAIDRCGVARYLHAPGPPCRTAFEDIIPLLVQ